MAELPLFLRREQTFCLKPLDNKREWQEAKVAFRKLREFLANDGWCSPDTYGTPFINISDQPGIYLFLAINRDFHDNGFVAYVGMATKLIGRIGTTFGRPPNHEVFNLIEGTDLWPQRWVKSVAAVSLRERERFYIQKFDPPYNIAGRRRGIR